MDKLSQAFKQGFKKEAFAPPPKSILKGIQKFKNVGNKAKNKISDAFRSGAEEAGWVQPEQASGGLVSDFWNELTPLAQVGIAGGGGATAGIGGYSLYNNGISADEEAMGETTQQASNQLTPRQKKIMMRRALQRR